MKEFILFILCMFLFSCSEKENDYLFSNSKWEYVEVVNDVRKTHVLSFGQYSFIHSVYTECLKNEDADPEIIEVGGSYTSNYPVLHLESFGKEKVYTFSQDGKTLHSSHMVFTKKEDNQ